MVASGGVALVVLGLTAFTAQSLYPDPGWQLRALQQYLAGDSPSPNHLVMPLATDLSRDSAEWITWWSPGTNLIAWPFMAMGLTVGITLRIIAAAAFFIGALGWARWWSLFDLPRWLALPIALGLPLIPHAHQPLFLFAAESFVYACTPWLLLTGYALHRELSHERPLSVSATLKAALAGLFLGSAYVLKYSAVFVALGVLVFLFLRLIHLPRSRWVKGVTLFGVAVVGFALPVLALTVANRILGGTANLVESSTRLAFSPMVVLHAVANPALAMFGADGLWRYILDNPSIGIARGSEVALPLVGIPGGLLVWHLVRTRSTDGPQYRLAQIAFITGMGLLILTWLVSSGASFEARHAKGASLAVAPLIVYRSLKQWGDASIRWRSVLAASAVFYMVAPILYGGGSMIGKLDRFSWADTTAQSIANPLVAPRTPQDAFQMLQSVHNEQSDVWYVTDPVTALDLPGRSIIVHADYIATEVLGKTRYVPAPGSRVLAVLPKTFEQSEKGNVIRQSFDGITSWERVPVPNSFVDLWIGVARVR